jgi:hypothetical protein
MKTLRPFSVTSNFCESYLKKLDNVAFREVVRYQTGINGLTVRVPMYSKLT